MVFPAISGHQSLSQWPDSELLKRAQRSVFRRPSHYSGYHAVPDLWQDERANYYYLPLGRDKREGDSLESPGTSHLAI